MLCVIVAGPDINTAVVTGTPEVHIVTTDSKVVCMSYNVAYKFLLLILIHLWYFVSLMPFHYSTRNSTLRQTATSRTSLSWYWCYVYQR